MILKPNRLLKFNGDLISTKNIVLFLIGVIILLISPFIFSIYYFISIFYLIYSKTRYYSIILWNFFILLVWYAFYHYYLFLLTLSSEFHTYAQAYPLDKLIVNDENILLLLLNCSVDVPSIFRSLFVETTIILYYLAKSCHLTIIIQNIF